MARARKESAGLIGIGIVFRQGEGAKRMIADIDAIGIGVVFGPGTGVLQIIPAVVLIHPCAFNKRHPTEQTADKGPELRRNAAFVPALLLQEILICRFDLLIRGGQKGVVFPRPFESDFPGMALDQR